MQQEQDIGRGRHWLGEHFAGMCGMMAAGFLPAMAQTVPSAPWSNICPGLRFSLSRCPQVASMPGLGAERRGD